ALESDADRVVSDGLAALKNTGLGGPAVAEMGGPSEAVTSAYQAFLDYQPSSGGSGGLLLREPKKDAGSKKAETKEEKPPNFKGNTRWIMSGGWPSVWVKTSWLKAQIGGATSLAAETPYPGLITTLMNQLRKRRGWTWIAAKDIAKAASQLGFSQSLELTGATAVKLDFAETILTQIGLPPGQRVRVLLQGRGQGLTLWIDLAYLRKIAPKEMAAETALTSTKLSVLARNQMEKVVKREMQPFARVHSETKGWKFPLGKASRYHRVQRVSVPEAFLKHQFGAAEWEAFRSNAKKSGGQPTLRIGGRRIVLPKGLDEAEKQKLLDLISQTYATGGKGAPPADIYVTARTLVLLRRLMKHPDKAALMALLRGSGKGEGASKRRWLADRLAVAFAQHEYGKLAKKMSVSTPETDKDAKGKVADEPVRGKIIQVAGRLVPKKKARFQVKIDNYAVAMRSRNVRVDWRIYKADKRGNRTGDVVASGLVSYDEFTKDQDDKTFETALGRGRYVAYAFVRHTYFHRNVFIDKDILVRPETEVLHDLEKDNLMGFKKGRGGKEKSEDFNLAAYGTGTRSEGTLHRLALADKDPALRQSKLLDSEVKQLQLLVKQYEKSPDYDKRSIASWAKDRLEERQKSATLLKGVSKGKKYQVRIRGTYVSRAKGAKDGPLKLVCWFDNKGFGHPYRGHLFDYSEAFESKSYHFEEDDSNYEKMMEKLFYELTSVYPDGRMSVAFQQYDGVKPTSKYVKLTRKTDTMWKDVKQTAFDPAIDIAVNVGAVVVGVFNPAAGIAIALVYNGSSSISTLMDLETKGLASWDTYLTHAGMLALDLLPAVGRAKKLVQVGGKTYWIVEGVQLAGQVMLVNAQIAQAVTEIRGGLVTDLANVEADIRNLEATNPSSSKLRTLRGRRRILQRKLLSAWDKVAAQAAKQGGIIVLSSMGAGKLAHLRLARTLKGNSKIDVLTGPEGKDLTIRYDYDQGRIQVGEKFSAADMGKAPLFEVRHRMNSELSSKIPDAAARKAVIEGAIAKGLEVRTGKTAGVRVINDGGKRVLEIGPGADQAAIRAALAKDKGAPAVAPPTKKADGKAGTPDAPGKQRDLTPTNDVGIITSGRGQVVVGSPAKNVKQGHEILARLAAGDRAALEALGGPKLPKDFDPRTTEWGLAKLPDGRVIVVRGRAGAVSWDGFPPNTKVLAHSHPFTESRKLQGVGKDGIDVRTLATEQSQIDNLTLLFPSSGDLSFMANNGVKGHQVHTPYVHVGNGKIASPGPGVSGPTVSIEIKSAKHAGGIGEIPVHSGKLVVRAGKKVLWKGDVYSVFFGGRDFISKAPPPGFKARDKSVRAAQGTGSRDVPTGVAQTRRAVMEKQLGAAKVAQI
ncbi:MAG: hypothetical protein ACI9OJ_004581, partial [Myxococcota bacterium]